MKIVDNKNLTKTAINGFSWMFAGTLGQNILQFATLVILARLITPAEFGVVTIAIMVIGILKIFTELGVGPAIVQRKDLNENHIKTANTLALVLALIFSAFLYLSASRVSTFFNMEELEKTITALSIMLPLSALSLVGQSLLQRRLKFKQIATLNLISYIIAYGFIAIPMAKLGYGIWSLVFAYLGQVTSMMLLVNLRIRESRIYGFDIKSAKQLLNYGFGSSLARVSNFFALEGDNIVIGKFLGAEALGFYGRAYQLINIPSALIGSVIDKVLFPIMSSIQEDKKRLSNAYIGLISITAMFLMPISAILIILSEEVIFILLGTQWDNVVPLFQILALILTFRMSYKFSDSVSRAVGAVYRRAWRQVVYASCVILFGLLGLPWGLEGVAIGVAFAILTNFILMLELTKKLLMFTWKEIIINHIKHMFVSLSLFIILLVSKKIISTHCQNDLTLIVTCLLIAVVYLFATWTAFSKHFKTEYELIKILISKLRR